MQRRFSSSHTNEWLSCLVGGSRGGCGCHWSLCLPLMEPHGRAPCSPRGDLGPGQGPRSPPLSSSCFLSVFYFRSKAQEEKWNELHHGPSGHVPGSAHCGRWVIATQVKAAWVLSAPSLGNNVDPPDRELRTRGELLGPLLPICWERALSLATRVVGEGRRKQKGECVLRVTCVCMCVEGGGRQGEIDHTCVCLET